MPRDLVKVNLIQYFEPGFNGAPVWVIRGWTVEDQPILLTVHTNKPLQAAACERALKTNRSIWISWKDGRFGARDMVTANLDESQFNHEASEVLS